MSSNIHKQIGLFYEDHRSDPRLQGRWRLFSVRASDTPHFIRATRLDGEEVTIHEQEVKVSTVPDLISPFDQPPTKNEPTTTTPTTNPS